MNILCDTCSVLMLIRIAPDMFCDDRFECVTIQEVIKEFFQTQKFKTSYPWRREYKSRIKAIGISEIEKGDFHIYLQSIKSIIETGKINKRTGKYFNLSRVDQLITILISNDLSEERMSIMQDSDLYLSALFKI